MLYAIKMSEMLCLLALPNIVLVFEENETVSAIRILQAIKLRTGFVLAVFHLHPEENRCKLGFLNL